MQLMWYQHHNLQHADTICRLWYWISMSWTLCCWCQCLMARNIFSVTVVSYRSCCETECAPFKNSVMSTIKIRFIRTLPEKCTTLALTAHSNCLGTECYQHSTMSLPHIHYGSFTYAILSKDSNRMSN